jgi:hypothetical protein
VSRLGLIEGFYGRPWSANERAETIAFLAPHGYGFYLYAPKADAFLRRRWREPFRDAHAMELSRVASQCRAHGVRFGMGLSPFELYRDFDARAKADLAAKLDAIAAVGAMDLAILFDDMRGDLPELAASQIRIMDWIGERAPGLRLIFCPTYYSDDPLLDRAFGSRPEGYLEALGTGLDRAVAIFWTGEEVCSRAYSPAHLQRVAETLRRAPLLWDNYPVNDGPIMSQALHLRGFTGRPASLAPHLAGHAVNPANQPVLSRIPALTLTESYAAGEAYDYGAATARACATVLGPELGALVHADIARLQDNGLDRLSAETKARLRQRYAAFDHPGAHEIVAWIDGAWTVTREEIDAS